MMELLSPAGSRDALIAAVQNGADAVYLGGQTLNARMGAGNFDADELKWAADYLHERGRKMYVTVNTLAKPSEIGQLAELCGQIATAGADAVIVQDLGVARVVSALLPSIALHASTQMAIHNRQGTDFLRQAGFSRAVLARELTFEEISECAGRGVEIECFAHGALCVSCSGQCLFSSIVGGRSGNRGQCAQPCRLYYRLEGEHAAQGHLLSPRDLMTLRDLPALERAGVKCLKIEGRLKRPEYVAVVTGIYRRAIDQIGAPVSAQDVLSLRQIFSRGGFTRGYGPGLSDSEFLSTVRPGHEGVPVDAAAAAGRVLLSEDLDEGDELILYQLDSAEGTPVKARAARAGQWIAVEGAQKNSALHRLTSERQLRAARESYQRERALNGLTGRLTARVGERARLSVSDGVLRAEAQTENEVERSRKPADHGRTAEQIKKTGGTPYEIVDLQMDVDPDAFLPVSTLNALRRDALFELSARRIEAHRGCAATLGDMPPALPDFPARTGEMMLRAQSSDPALLMTAARAGADEVIFAPADLTRSGLDRAAEAMGDTRFALALPQVAGGDALEILHEWAWQRSERIGATLLSNPGQLSLDWPGELQADWGLNIMNRHALDFLRGYGIARYTPSLELNSGEIESIMPGGAGRELLVYGRIPLMQLRHCPIRARLGGAHADCRYCDRARPGEKLEDHTLIDRYNNAFPLRRQKMPGGCAVTLVNSATLMPLRHVARLPKAEAWRLMLDGESPDFASELIHVYRMAQRGEAYQSAPGWAALDEMNTTGGHYFRGVL